MDLKGKVALVTGGSMGIGTAISLDLAENGADVALTYRSHEAEARAVAEKIRGMGCTAKAYKIDVSEFAAVQNLVDMVIQNFDRLDILINNAGMNWDGVIWKMTEDQWDKVIEVNLKGYFNYVRACVPVFRDQQYGKIVNVTSINGLRGKFGQSNYTASKGGIIGFTKTLARELGNKNVNVNAVAPGLIETDMVAAMDDAAKQRSLSEIIMGGLGQPEDVANAVAFLASDLARHVTGQVLNVDGGQLIA